MAPETLTTLDGLLKDVYADVIREQISTYDAIQEVFEQMSDAEFDGRQIIEGAIMSLNEGVGAVAEDANLPTAGNFDPQQFKIKMKYVYGSFQMTKQMMESAQTSKGAFKNATRYSFETLVRNLRRERARMLWYAGTGVVALVNGTVSASTTVNVDAPGNVAGSVGGARYLRKNMLLAFSDDGGTTLTAVRKVSSVAAAGTSIVVDSAVTLVDNATIYHISLSTSTSFDDSGKDNEPLGILGLVDDTTFLTTLHGLSRTTFPQLKSRVQPSVGALSLDAIQLNFDIADQLGDTMVDCLACHHAVRRAYLVLLEADRRYTGADLKSPDGGTKAVKRGSYVTFGGVPLITSKYAPYDMLFGLYKGEFKRYTQIDGEWADESGAILRQVTGKDTWTAFYRLWENYQLSRPNTCFRMEGITTSKVYVASF